MPRRGNGGSQVLNPAYGVPDYDDTWEGDAKGTSEVGGKEVKCGDYREKLGKSKMMKCMYCYLWMIMYMAKVVLCCEWTVSIF